MKKNENQYRNLIETNKLLNMSVDLTKIIEFKKIIETFNEDYKNLLTFNVPLDFISKNIEETAAPVEITEDDFEGVEIIENEGLTIENLWRLEFRHNNDDLRNGLDKDFESLMLEAVDKNRIEEVVENVDVIEVVETEEWK